MYSVSSNDFFIHKDMLIWTGYRIIFHTKCSEGLMNNYWKIKTLTVLGLLLFTSPRQYFQVSDIYRGMEQFVEMWIKGYIYFVI